MYSNPKPAVPKDSFTLFVERKCKEKCQLSDSLLSFLEPAEGRRIPTPLKKKRIGMSFGTEPILNYEWSFGYDGHKPFLNLTTDYCCIVGLITSHMILLYNYEYQTILSLCGHVSNLEQITSDSSGRWLAALDKSKNNRIVIWDLGKGVPVKTIFLNNENAQNLLMSPEAKYLLHTINEQPCKLYFYIWSANRQKPAATVNFDKHVKNILNVCFSKRCEEYIAVTTPTHIIFLTYNMENHVIEFYNPKTNRYWPKTQLEYTCSVYDDELNLCYSATTAGDLAFWGDDSVTNRFLNKGGGRGSVKSYPRDLALTNNLDGKFFLRLHKYKIIKLRIIDGYIVCLDDESFITFYDQHLSNVYVFNEFFGDKIVDFQMNLSPRFYSPTYEKPSLADSAFLDTFSLQEKKVSIAKWQDVADSYAKMEMEGAHIFKSRDLIIQTENNQLVYLNPVRKFFYGIFEDSIHNATAIETSPIWNYLYIGSSFGDIYVYDYEKKERLLEQKITPKNGNEASISCLKSSTNGNILACGMSDGTLYCLEPSSLNEIPEQNLHKSKKPIFLIDFCNESAYMAYADQDSIVALFTIEPEFSLIGMFRAHYKPITGITFAIWDSTTKLYSIGRDGYLNEYNVKECEQNGHLRNSRRTVIEIQTEPLAFLPAPVCSKMLIISMTCFHFRYLDTDTMTLADIKKAPSLLNPVDKFMDLECGNLSGNKYYLFGSGSKLGVLKGPIDGNPFKWMTIRAGTSKITNLCASRDGLYAFSITETASYVQMWKINPGNLDFLERIGGRGLKPYFALLKGGKHNPIIKQLQELFCLALMQHQGLYKLQEMEVSPSREITLCEVPSVLRAMGVFPTNIEIESLININSLKSSLISNHKITFNCFAKFFFNLYYDDDYTYKKLEEAFHTICSFKSNLPENQKNTKPIIQREDFIKLLEEEGEKFSPMESYNLLRTLVGHKEGDRYFYGELEDISDFKFLPPKISFQYFAARLIGFERMQYDENEEIPDKIQLNLYEGEPFLIKEVNKM